jgi:hypothetical protein
MLRERQMERQRYQTLGDAITSSYDTASTGMRWPNLLRKGSPAWFALAVLVIVVAVAAAGLAIARMPRTRTAEAQPQPQKFSSQGATAQQLAEQNSADQQLAAESVRPPVTKPANSPAAPTPAPTPVPTSTPTPAPTATPSSAPTTAPTATASAAIVSTAPDRIHNAPLLVTSNDDLKVGKPGSCGGQDKTIDVAGYPRGCTVFDAVSSGPLKNGRGTVLVVPVSTSEDVSDTAYGLLYLQSDADSPPHYIGILGDGSGRIVVRVQSGFIVVQDATGKKSYTFDGGRIKQV